MNEYTLLFLTGILGSAHCAGMCGPIVLAYATNLNQSDASLQKRSFLQMFSLHLTYNIGRISMWIFLGMTLGLAGMFLAEIANFGRFLAFFSGLLMIAFGVGNLGFLPKFNLSGDNSHWLWNFYRKGFQALIRQPGLTGKFGLGLVNGLLPCGLSYAILAKAAASGSFLKGGAVMLAFGLGTIPGLMFVGFAATRLSPGVRKWGEGLAAAAVIFMGVVLLLRGLGLHLPFLHPAIHGH